MAQKYVASRIQLIISLLAVSLLPLLVADHAFFWDTVQLASMHAHWYFDNDFAYFLLPDNMDSGHPPTMGMYLAGCWKLFGRSLLVSHLAMLPFLWGIVFFLFRIGRRLTTQHSAIFLILWVLADPFFLGQAVLVSPDIVLLCFMLISISGILEKRNTWIILGSIGLVLISLRGMMVLTALFLWNLWEAGALRPPRLKPMIRVWLPYIPAGLIGLAFLGYHYLEKGWVGYHEASPWAPTFAKASPKEVVYNLGILGWRFLDHGRIVVWLVLALLFWKGRKNFIETRRLASPILAGIVALFLCLFIVLIPTLVLHKHIMHPRYLLPLFLALHFFLFSWLSRQQPKLFFPIWGLVFIALLSGNLWVYPKQIAQGWDCTAAHLPYYDLRGAAIEYLKKESIPITAVGTAFPNLNNTKYIDLADDGHRFANKDLENNEYFLYSNIMNDLSDEELQELERWTVVVEKRKWPVEVVVYRKRD